MHHLLTTTTSQLRTDLTYQLMTWIQVMSTMEEISQVRPHHRTLILGRTGTTHKMSPSLTEIQICHQATILHPRTNIKDLSRLHAPIINKRITVRNTFQPKLLISMMRLLDKETPLEMVSMPWARISTHKITRKSTAIRHWGRKGCSVVGLRV